MRRRRGCTGSRGRRGQRTAWLEGAGEEEYDLLLRTTPMAKVEAATSTSNKNNIKRLLKSLGICNGVCCQRTKKKNFGPVSTGLPPAYHRYGLKFSPKKAG